MAGWRTLAGLVVGAALVGPVGAQTYPLKEEVKPGDSYRARLTMSLKGEIRVTRDDKPQKLSLSAEATHEFPERVLTVGDAGLPSKVARYYETARAVISAAGDRSEKALRKNRCLVVAQRQNDVPLTYSPTGPFTREELELTAEHFDTLALPGLLPGRAVAVGDTWKLDNRVVQAICHFEGVTEHELTGKLEEVTDQVARFSITGPASGIELGALVKLKVEATGRFDLEKKRLVALEWKQTDDREQGPASPSMEATSTTTLTRTPAAVPEALADVALVSVPAEFKVPVHLTGLEYRDPQGRFDLVHAREWQVVGTPQGRLVLRLMERGDFVAQATVTPWTPAPKGKRLSDDEFREAMARTPGWDAEKELQAGEVPGGDGRTIFRISTLGKMDGVAVMQNFYLVAGTNGEQVVVAVTLTPKKADQLGSRDLSLAGSIEFPKK